MRHIITYALIATASLALLAGCGIAPDVTEFVSNDRAKELLGGQTWADPSGGIELQFDDDGKLIRIGGNALPDELEGIKINGDPFEITVPDDIDYVGGKTFTVTFEPTKTIIGDDGSIEIAFEGAAAEVSALVDSITLTVTADSEVNGNGQATIGNVEVSLNATVALFGITIPVFTEQFDEELTLQI